MKKKWALYPGTFDPITNGHVDIIERSLSIFDGLIVVVASSIRKSPLLSVDERVQLIKKHFKKNPRIKVMAWDGLVVDLARKHKAVALIRGLRAAGDFEYEFMMSGMNKELNPKVETIFMMTGSNLFFVSSSMIKEVLKFGGNIQKYVPPVVSQYLKGKR